MKIFQKTKSSGLEIFVLLFVLIFPAPIAFGQSGAAWEAYKRANNIDPRWTYNAWIKAGSPAGGGASLSTADQAAQEAAVEQQRAAAAEQQIRREAQSLTQQGSQALDRGDFEAAILYFREALEKTPGDSGLSDAIAVAKDSIDRRTKREQEVFREEKMEGLRQLKGISSDGDVDVDGLVKEPSASANPDELKSLPTPNPESNIVDARDVPSGLPNSVEDAIIAGYSKAPPGVADRVRKGFQAVTMHDWKVAKAWFEDAFNHDLNNVGLQRLVELADYTESRIQSHAVVPSKPAQPPLDSDMQFLFPGWKPSAKAGGPPMMHGTDDVEFLFPGLPALEAREMDDYIFDQALIAAENDPILRRLSNRTVTGKIPVN